MGKKDKQVKISVREMGQLGFVAKVVGPRVGLLKQKRMIENTNLKMLMIDVGKVVEEMVSK